ncbi:MAG: electron transport complex protein RnfA [Bacilli bacterium]
MSNLITIAFAAFLTENVILSQIWGVCPFLGVSTKRKNAIGMGLAVTLVIFVATLITWLLYHYVLIPLNIVYLQILVFILVIASLVQMIEMFMKKTMPSLYRALGIYLPLITTNCAVLGVANASVDKSFIEMLVYAIFSGLGFLFVMYIFSGLREKITKAPIPEGFKGFPIALIAASGLALIFARLGGII